LNFRLTQSNAANNRLNIELDQCKKELAVQRATNDDAQKEIRQLKKHEADLKNSCKSTNEGYTNKIKELTKYTVVQLFSHRNISSKFMILFYI
jgi:hypothetical protein